MVIPSARRRLGLWVLWLASWAFRLANVSRFAALTSVVVIADPTWVGLLAFLAEFCGHFASPAFLRARFLFATMHGN